MAPVTLLLTSALFLPAFVRGANDWSKPCFEGTCSWDVDNGSSSSGGITLSGSSGAISDITTAAGWELLSCTTNGTTTTARVVCSSSDTAEAGCAHVETNGAENKVVRMPKNCGAAPFGRVVNLTDSADQSIPSTTARRLHRRAGAPTPQVKEINLDVDWSAISTSKNGKIEMYITGANVPGANDVHNTGATRRRRSTQGLSRRGFFGSAISSIGSAVSSAAKSAESAVTGAAGDVASGAQAAVSAVTSVAAEATSAVASVATEAASAVVSAAGTAESAVSGVNNFNETKTFALDPINFNEPFSLVNQTFGCAAGKFNADINANGNAQANAQMSVGIVAAGTIVPPQISQFQAIINGNANFAGNLNLDVTTQGKFDSSPITLIGPIGLTPFEIPGIFTAGPSFSVTGQLTSDLGLGANMNATVNWNSSNIQIFFPPQNGQSSSADTNVNSSPLQLALTPNIEADGIASLHLTPTLDLGLNAFANKVSADIFVDLDASLNLGANASASSSAVAGNGSVGSQIANNAEFSGCTNLTTTLAFNAGATGDFFGLFNEKTQVPIFSHTFDLFAKCFGGDSDNTSTDAASSSDAASATVAPPPDAASSSDAVSATMAPPPDAAYSSDAASATIAPPPYAADYSAAPAATPDAVSASASASAYAYAPAYSASTSYRAARSIQQRAARRPAESVAQRYHKRGPFAILAPRDNSSCPPSDLSIVESVVDAVTSVV